MTPRETITMSLFLLSAVALTSLFNPAPETPLVNELSLYEDSKQRFQFEYPREWGETKNRSEHLGFDTGTRELIEFELNPNIFISLFSDDFSEGVGEGSLQYFSSSSLTEDYKDLEEISIMNKGGYKTVQDFGYVEMRPALHYLLPDYLEDTRIKNVMVLGSFGEDAEALEVEEQLEKVIKSMTPIEVK